MQLTRIFRLKKLGKLGLTFGPRSNNMFIASLSFMSLRVSLIADCPTWGHSSVG